MLLFLDSIKDDPWYVTKRQEYSSELGRVITHYLDQYSYALLPPVI